MSRVFLKDISLNRGEYGIPASATTYIEGNYRYLRISDITEDGHLDDSDIKGAEGENLEQYLLKENDIVFARTGNSTGRAYFYEKKDGCLIYAGFLIKYSLDERVINPKYMKYFTISKEYKKWIQNTSVGSTRGGINAKTLLNLPITLPSRKQQDELVSVLSALDDQIELNNKINQELETLAQTLYNYWFVQFEFPNEEGTPYKSSGGKMVWNEELKREIPEGWEVKKLSNLSKVLTGKKDANFANKEGKYKFFTCSQEVYKCDEFDFDGDAILIAGNGDFNVKTYSGKFNAYQRTYVVLPNNKIHYSLIALSVEKNILSFKANAQGSIVKFIKKGDVEEIRITIPNNNRTLNELNQIRKTIQQNKEQIEELVQLRDYLLPLLMNGQVTVSDSIPE